MWLWNKRKRGMNEWKDADLYLYSLGSFGDFTIAAMLFFLTVATSCMTTKRSAARTCLRRDGLKLFRNTTSTNYQFYIYNPRVAMLRGFFLTFYLVHDLSRNCGWQPQTKTAMHDARIIFKWITYYGYLADHGSREKSQFVRKKSNHDTFHAKPINHKSIKYPLQSTVQAKRTNKKNNSLNLINIYFQVHSQYFYANKLKE